MSERNGVPVSASRRRAGSKASRTASPHDSASPAWCTSSRITSVLKRSVRMRCASGLAATPAYVSATPTKSLLVRPLRPEYAGSSGMPTFAAASAHCVLRCSVGATTVIRSITRRDSSSAATVSANVVLPAPGVATARKSRCVRSKYAVSAAVCQARRLVAVPQAARSG